MLVRATHHLVGLTDTRKRVLLLTLLTFLAMC